MTDQVEMFVDGELVETRTVVLPADPPTAAHVLRQRITALEAVIEEQVADRLAAVEQRTQGLDLTRLNEKLQRIEDRIGKSATQAAGIDPNAVEEPGARAEIAKVKDALTPDLPANETEVV